MTSRDAILEALRRAAPPERPLPEPPAGIRYADPEKQFQESLQGVGGRFVRATDLAGVNADLAAFEPYARARRVASLVPGAGRADVDLAALPDPHGLEGIDLAIVPGAFGVAENGAVWIPGSGLGPHRGVFVVAQHLAIVVPAGAMVSTMHEAYDRIRFERPGFGLFISGPSKTADIEQALVIGAQGPRSLVVCLV